LKVTMPVGVPVPAEAATLALSITLVPTVTLVDETVSVVVDACSDETCVPVSADVLDACTLPAPSVAML
jgi:hypothetical protein